MHTGNDWAIVLAAGDGTRLSLVTDRGGMPVPKQYWSLRGGRSLLGDALARAGRVAALERTVVIVAEKHRALWEPELAHLPAENVIVQPSNRGTAAGLLLPLLAIHARDPEARVAVLPSDHFVDDEQVLGAALRASLATVERDGYRVVLLGIRPEGPETGYGWIVPKGRGAGLDRVEEFVEKPDAARAAALLERGAVWNSFLLAGRADRLIGMCRARLPRIAVALTRAFAGAPEQRSERLAACYAELQTGDFSRDVLQGAQERLLLCRVPACGWTDLGTPERVAECLERHALQSVVRGTSAPRTRARFDLGQALRQFAFESRNPDLVLAS